MRVIPFGISSGRPTADRHVSGLALDLGPTWILVDAGEGTQQQVMRSRLRFSRLAAVFLTHLHGDHIFGLPGLLATVSSEGRTDPLPVFGPTGVRRWLDSMAEQQILVLDHDLPVTELPIGPEGETGEPIALGEIAGLDVTAELLRHRVPSFGYRFTEPDRPGRVDTARARELGLDVGPDLGRLQRGEPVDGIAPEQVIGPPRRGRVVAVLGDTARSDAAVRLGTDADLLVHECTYAAAEHDLCERWTHSCTRDVAAVTAAARPRTLLVDHFSTRYPDPERLAAEVRAELDAASVRVDGEPITVRAAVEGEPVPIPRR